MTAILFWASCSIFVYIGISRILLPLLARLKRPKSLPPTSPWGVIPYWDHLMIFIKGSATMASAFLPHIGSQIPVRFKLPGSSVYLVSGPKSVRSVLYNPHSFPNRNSRRKFIRNVFGVSDAAVQMIWEDSSGSAPLPLPGSNVPQHRRVLRMQQETTFDALSSTGFASMLPRYAQYLEQTILESEVGTDWKEFPNIFKYVLHLAFCSSINMLCGPDLIRMSPEFETSFWIFDANVHYLHLGFPRWGNPAAWEAREKCHQAIGKWRALCLSREEEVESKQSDGVFDDIWGTKIMKMRNKSMFDLIPEFDDRARNGADLGFLWGSNDNLAPTMTWLMLELLRSREHRDRFLMEASNALLPAQDGDTLPRFDVKIMMKQPFMLSMYHEVLRMQVTSMLARDIDKDESLGDYEVRKGSLVLVSTHSEHMDKSRWETRPGAENHPVEEFWPERFLEHRDDTDGPVFTTKGLEATFIPFGIGRSICPGRHFASRAAMIVVATLLTAFDFEPIGDEGWSQPKTNWQGFGYTAFRPSRAVPFRMRRKQE